MMTQSVMTQAANLFGSTTGSTTASTTVKGKQTGNGFNMFIDNSLKPTQSTAIKPDNMATKKTAAQVTNAKNDTPHDDTDTTEVQSDKVTSDKTAKTETTKATEQKSDTQSADTKNMVNGEEEQTSPSEDVTVSDEVMAQIVGMLQSIQDTVMNTLNLSQEEFNQLLTDQGMTLTDLLQPENLQQFVLASKGQTDILAVLTDENLADTLKELLQTVDGIISESKISLSAEQIKSVLQQAETVSMIQKESKEPVVQTVNSKEESVKPEEVVSSVPSSEDDEKQITVKAGTDKSTISEAAKSEVATTGNTGTKAGSDSEAHKDLNSSNHFQTFVDNLVKASTTTQVENFGGMTQVTEIRQIANQIIDRIKVSIMPEQTSMELQLNPENLGKVNLSVQSKSGVMTAQFVVQNEICKEAIESQMQTLRDTLNQQGIKVDAIEVTVAANAFEQSNNEDSNNQTETSQNNSGKKITLEEAINMTEEVESESNQQDVTGIRGSMVDYTA